MNIRFCAEDAGWTIREAAWSLEERVLWRGGDASREALERVGTAMAPLQRLIQTRLIWPLSDFLQERSARTRAALTASAAALAFAAAGAGAITAPGDPAAGTGAPPARAAPVAVQAAAHTPALQGVVPQFQPGRAPVPAEPPAKPSAPPAQVAWQFSRAFVGYEIGRPGERVDEVFAATATKQLAKALAADPPRLPVRGKVPRARVLNVVLGARAIDARARGSATRLTRTASVSLVRLRAISELRLTLTNSGDGWQVAQVLG
jgi:hypothetical protein